MYRDFLYFENGVPCSGDIDCWEMENGQTARFRDDAINTLKTLQQAPGGERWELIDWTDASQHLAVKLQHFLSTQGVEIAHTLAAHEWDTADYHFEKNWNGVSERSVNRLISPTRPLKSMCIVHSDHSECLPQDNTNGVGLSAQYSFRQIEMVKEAGRDNHFSKTLVLNLVQDFVSIDKGTCAGKKDCREVKVVGSTTSTYAVQFRNDAINTLKELQEGNPGRGRWEFIIWTDLHRKFAETFSQMLLSKGVQIAHILDGSNRDDCVDGLFDLGRRDIMQLASERRPLDSMFIAHKDPTQRWNLFPQENSVELKALYRYLYRQIDTVREVGRHKQYSKTLILNLEQDFVYIEKGKDCGKEKENCREPSHDRFKYSPCTSISSN